MKDTALKVAGIIFLLVSLMHLARAVLKLEVTMAGIIVPLWFSGLGCIVALGLAVWMFSAIKK